MKEEKRFFLIKKVNCSALDIKKYINDKGEIDWMGVHNDDIIGITHDEEYAKSIQSVFCDYIEVKLINEK